MPHVTKQERDAYLNTMQRTEASMAPLDQADAITSIAISLKRIADALDNNTLGGGIYDAIYNAIVGAERRPR